MKGTITSDDVGDHLTNEERLTLFYTSISNRLALGEIKKTIESHETHSDDLHQIII